MAVSATEVDNIIVRLIGDATSYQRMIDSAITSTKSATQQMQASSKQIQGVSSSIGMLTASISSLLVATAGTGNTLAAFSEFDKTMTESIAIMKVTDSQIQQMRKSALDLAPAAGMGPEVLARGFYYLASSGLDAERSISALPAIVDFAVAGNFELARATTLASDAQAALGLKVKDNAKNLENLVRITDVLVKGNILSNTTTEQLSRALSTGAAAAGKIFGKQVEEVAAVLAVFADQGIKAEVAGNALSRVFRLLGYAAVKHKEEFKKLGITVYDTTGNMRNTADIIEDLEKAFAPLSDSARVAALEMLGFEARVQHAVLPLLGTSKQIREFEKELKSAGGTTKEVAETTRTSFSFQMRALAANIKVVAVEIGAFLAPAIARVADIINISINFWKALGVEVKQTTIAIGTFLLTMAGLGPIRNILTALASLGMAAITPLINLFGVLALAIANPFRILIFWFNPAFIIFRNLISIVAAVVVSIQKVGGAGDAFRQVEEALIDVWRWLKPIKDAIVDLALSAIQKAIEAFLKLGDVMLDVIKTVSQNINIDWKKVQYGIVTSIKFIEFNIINFGKIASMIGSAIYKAFLPLIGSFNAGEVIAVNYAKAIEIVVRNLVVMGIIVTSSLVAWKSLSIVIGIVTAVLSILQPVIISISISMTFLTSIIAFLTAAYKALGVILILINPLLNIARWIALSIGVALVRASALLLAPALQIVAGAILGVWLGASLLITAVILLVSKFGLLIAKTIAYYAGVAVGNLILLAFKGLLILINLLLTVNIFTLAKLAVLQLLYVGHLALMAIGQIVYNGLIAVYNSLLVIGSVALTIWNALTIANLVALIQLTVAMALHIGHLTLMTIGQTIYNAAIAIATVAVQIYTFIMLYHNTILKVSIIVLKLLYAAVVFVVVAYKLLMLAVTLVVGVITTLISIVQVAALGIIYLAVSAIGLLATALSYIIAPIVGVYLGLYELTKALQQIPTDTGALVAIGDVFREWVRVIMLVVDAMNIDMTLAWQIFQAGVELGIEQIKALWPSLWSFIKEGFSIAGGLIKDVIGEVFDYLKVRIDLSQNYWTWQINESQLKTAIEKAGEGFETAVELLTSNAGEKFKEAASKVELIDNDTIKNAKKKIDELETTLVQLKALKEFDEFDEGITAALAKAKAEAEKIGPRLGEGIENGSKKGKHAIDDLKSSILGSAEAISRLQHYTDLFFLNDKGKLANLNQEGVQSGLKALGIKQEYKPDTEWAEARAKMEEAENMMFKMGDTFVNTLANTDWETVLQGLNDQVNEIANNILYHTNIEDTGIITGIDSIDNILNSLGNISNINWQDSLQGFNESISELANTILHQTNVIDTGILTQDKINAVATEIQNQLEGNSPLDLDSLRGLNSDEIARILEEISKNTREMADEESLEDLLSIGGLE